MSSFFTTPASQRKRKRVEAPSSGATKRNVTATGSRPAKVPRRREREESISGSESSDDEEETGFFENQDDSATSEDEAETAAEKRLRLAQRYLENVKNEVEVEGFDAADIDRDLIAERLKEDVAETKGKVYRRIAENLDFEGAPHAFGKSHIQHAITGCATKLPHAWTISKDMVVEKWELPSPKTYKTNDPSHPSNITPRRTPKRLFWKKGNKNKKKDPAYIGHTGCILSIALSDSGKFLATGDENARLIIWDADTLTPRKMFTQHRDAVTSLSFRRGTEQLFSASADRTIKIWSASELSYIETLFGHQNTVVGIAGGLEVNQETCVSVGSRDRTARLWKVVEENQLVFRGGGTARQKGMDKLRKERFGKKAGENAATEDANGILDDEDAPIAYAEGSIDCVALLDAGLFVTGSDNGALALWSINKKKPLFTVPLAHGRDPPIPPEEMSANADAAESGKAGPRLPRYITALTTVPFADLILTASWDGWVRAWRIGPEKRTIEAVGKVGRIPPEDLPEPMDGVDGMEGYVQASENMALVRGIVNGLSAYERGERGKEGLCIVAAVGKEARLGRWMNGGGKNGIMVFEVPKKVTTNGVEHDSEEEGDA